jgi:hypothetical protein
MPILVSNAARKSCWVTRGRRGRQTLGKHSLIQGRKGSEYISVVLLQDHAGPYLSAGSQHLDSFDGSEDGPAASGDPHEGAVNARDLGEQLDDRHIARPHVSAQNANELGEQSRVIVGKALDADRLAPRRRPDWDGRTASRYPLTTSLASSSLLTPRRSSLLLSVLMVVVSRQDGHVQQKSLSLACAGSMWLGCEHLVLVLIVQPHLFFQQSSSLLRRIWSRAETGEKEDAV